MRSEVTLPSGWTQHPLESLAVEGSVTYGVVQPGQAVSGGVPMVRVNNFRGFGLDTSDVLSIATEVEAKYSRTRLRADDVLITVVGTVGQVAVVPPSLVGWNVARAVAVIRPKEAKFSRWIALALRAPESQRALGVAANTTVQTTINLKDLRKLSVPMPQSKEREAIELLLGSLDDRIDLLRKTNATLESIAQALFKSWFIDFDPVRAKAEGREPDGMDAATAALFPAEFEESALGLIPKGWRAGSLGDLSTLNAASWTARRAPAEVAYIDLAGVKSNVFDPPQRYSFVEAPSRARRELKAGDTLVGTVRPGNRSFGFVAEAEPGLTGSTGFAVLSPTSPFAAAFVYLGATRDENIDRLAALADGGAYPAVRPELVQSTACVMPPTPVLKAFHAVASPLLLSVAANAQRAHCLAELRDALLPRLISGKLRLPEAEPQLEEAIA